MGFDLRIFGDAGLSGEFIKWLVSEKASDVENHFGKLWDYYANPTEPLNELGMSAEASDSCRLYAQAQECGLPSRITGVQYWSWGGSFAGRNCGDGRRKEVVIENDICWRVNALVDFLFGKEIVIASKAPEPRRAEINEILKALFEVNGAIGFFQDMAVLGSVYGFVDCVVRAGENLLNHVSNTSKNTSKQAGIEAASEISLELIEASRALPILEENDYRKIRYYVQNFLVAKNEVTSAEGGSAARKVARVVEIVGPGAWQRYEGEELAAEGEMPWGFVPVVHIQNLAQPYYYEGISEVEQLVPMQDELNTRLSDRANRITLQSFKMYLVKGLDGVEKRPVSPGRMWCTDNMEASIEAFGGDASAPSEDMHITEVREAIDKASGVTPIVAGVLKSKLGNLTSAVALKLAMQGTLPKTERKWVTYGRGIKQICRMVLEMLDKAGVYATNDVERDVEIIWPSPLPENLLEKLEEARIKKELGVDGDVILRELGYER